MSLSAVAIGAVGAAHADANAVLVVLFAEHAVSLVRMARLFVDDTNAAEDVVQEAFLRLQRHLDKVKDPAKAAPYLRAIVLNLARDHNRRGLVSLRHRSSESARPHDDATDDDLLLHESQREVVEALRRLPLRQRDCLVLRYYLELGIADIAETLNLSQNSVKTHLQRGLASLEKQLEGSR